MNDPKAHSDSETSGNDTAIPTSATVPLPSPSTGWTVILIAACALVVAGMLMRKEWQTALSDIHLAHQEAIEKLSRRITALESAASAAPSVVDTTTPQQITSLTETLNGLEARLVALEQAASAPASLPLAEVAPPSPPVAAPESPTVPTTAEATTAPTIPLSPLIAAIRSGQPFDQTLRAWEEASGTLNTPIPTLRGIAAQGLESESDLRQSLHEQLNALLNTPATDAEGEQLNAWNTRLRGLVRIRKQPPFREEYQRLLTLLKLATPAQMLAEIHQLPAQAATPLDAWEQRATRHARAQEELNTLQPDSTKVAP